jgi:DNA-binding FrmR family transcriptional regulator
LDHHLIADTQGRGYWIFDDLSTLHQFDEVRQHGMPFLFTPRATRRIAGGWREKPNHMGTNPLSGVAFYYLLDEELDGEVEVQLEILEADGVVIRSFTRKPSDDPKNEEGGDEDAKNSKLLETEVGMNCFRWDLAYAGAKKFKGMVLWNGGLDGPRAIPGQYRARLTVGDWSQEVPFEILADPRSSASGEDYEAQFQFLLSVREKITQVHEAIESIRRTNGELDALTKRLEHDEGVATVVEAAKALKESLTAVEEALYQTKMRSRQDPLNYPFRVNDKLAGLLAVAGFGDNRPTQQSCEVRDALITIIDVALAKIDGIRDGELASFNALARTNEVPAVTLN